MPTVNIKDITESKIVRLVDLSEDSINKIAEAVVQKIAEPVIHGHWGEEWFDHKNKIVCSVCGCFADKWTDYCPNCGAKMDEVEDE